jgi:hypothetical protein
MTEKITLYLPENVYGIIEPHSREYYDADADGRIQVWPVHERWAREQEKCTDAPPVPAPAFPVVDLPVVVNVVAEKPAKKVAS